MIISDEMTADLPGPPWLHPRAAYVHVPFCAHHCGYCDFAVAVGQEQQMDDYLEALDLELARLERPQRVTTLFFGGGTPSFLDLKQTERLFDIVSRWLVVEPGGEVSLEANPDDVTEEKARLWAERGMTRLSLGAQSFNPDVLRVLERKHEPAQVPLAVERARRFGFQAGLDLIFAVPGQTLEDWNEDVRRILDLKPDHVSTYGLTFEKGTRLWKQRATGQVQSLEEEAELAMYLRGKEALEAAGLEHYEISNFAAAGKRCRHNLVYWANHAHWGLGMGAASYVRGVRRLNTRGLSGYIRRARSRGPIHFQEEELDPRARALETLAIQLRRLEGIERTSFESQTGFSLDDLIGEQVGALIGLELLEDVKTNVRLTQKGLCLADGVIQEVFKAQ